MALDRFKLPFTLHRTMEDYYVPGMQSIIQACTLLCGTGAKLQPSSNATGTCFIADRLTDTVHIRGQKCLQASNRFIPMWSVAPAQQESCPRQKALRAIHMHGTSVSHQVKFAMHLDTCTFKLL